MKITLIRIGKLHLSFANEGYAEYMKRLQHYVKFNDELLVVNSKSNESNNIKKVEAEAIMKKIGASDTVILLAAFGKKYTSEKFAEYVEQMQMKTQHLVFVIGGAYGFDDSIYARATGKLS